MVGKRVQQLRLKRGMSLSELAEKAGVSKSYLSTIERDVQSNPSMQPDDQHEQTKLDEEWYQLVREAMDSGVSKEQFREFLEFNKWRIDRSKK